MFGSDPTHCCGCGAETRCGRLHRMLRPTGRAAATVAWWLGPAPASASNDAMPEFIARPERLGIGAKYVPHSAALSIEERKFSKKLKGESREGGQSVSSRGEGQRPQAAAKADKKGVRAHDDDDSEEEEGRSAVRRKRPQGAEKKAVSAQKRKHQ